MPQTWSDFSTVHSGKTLVTVHNQLCSLYNNVPKNHKNEQHVFILLIFAKTPPNFNTWGTLQLPLYPLASSIAIIPWDLKCPVVLPKYHLGKCCFWSDKELAEKRVIFLKFHPIILLLQKHHQHWFWLVLLLNTTKGNQWHKNFRCWGYCQHIQSWWQLTDS